MENGVPTEAAATKKRIDAFRAGLALGAKIGAVLGAACGIVLSVIGYYFAARIDALADPARPWFDARSIGRTLGEMALFTAFGTIAGAAILGLAGLLRPEDEAKPPPPPVPPPKG